jgi:hypothetical protein
MAFSDYFSFRTTVSVENDPPGQLVSAFAEYERRTGDGVSSRKSYSWNPDGTIDKAPLF